MNTLAKLLGSLCILGGLIVLLWQPGAETANTPLASPVGGIFTGLGIILIGVLAIGLSYHPQLTVSVDEQDREAGTSTPNQGDRTAISKAEREAWQAIWSDQQFIGALLAEGVTRDQIAQVSEEDLANPGPDFVVSPGALFVADTALFDRMEELSSDELQELGYYDERPPHGPAVVDLNLPVEPDSAESDSEPDPSKQKTCSCRWVWTIADNPSPAAHDSWHQHGSASGEGHWFNYGPAHGMVDAWSNNCQGAEGSMTDKAGWMVITSKIVCDPNGCCAPKGRALAVSDYRSKIAANSESGFCFYLSTFANAVAADAVQLYVDGKLIPGGSGAVMTTSGANVIASLSAEVGAGGGAGPDGTQFSGNGKVGISVTRSKADGMVADVLNRFGAATVNNPGIVSELQTGAKTLANVHRKAAALAEQLTNIAGMGQVGVETECGAGSFWAYKVINTRGPIGRAGKAAFVKRFRLLRDQFLPS